MRTRESTEAEIVHKLTALRAAPDREKQTTLAREAAEGAVLLREFFTDGTGNPDYAGRSHAYRVAMRDLWSKAGFRDADERDTAQARVRYHVGNIIRERVDAETLEAAGLQAPSPREQTSERKRAVAALAESARQLTQAVTDQPITGDFGVTSANALSGAEQMADVLRAAGWRVEPPTGRPARPRTGYGVGNAYRERVCQWARDNGLNPEDIPMDATFEVSDDTITTEIIVRGEDGKPIVAGYRVLRERVTVPLRKPWTERQP